MLPRQVVALDQYSGILLDLHDADAPVESRRLASYRIPSGSQLLGVLATSVLQAPTSGQTSQVLTTGCMLERSAPFDSIESTASLVEAGRSPRVASALRRSGRRRQASEPQVPDSSYPFSPCYGAGCRFGVRFDRPSSV